MLTSNDHAKQTHSLGDAAICVSQVRHTPLYTMHSYI